MSAPSNNRRDAGVNAPAAGKAAKTQGDLAQDSFFRQINLISPAKGFLEHDHLVLKGTANGARRSKRSLPVDAAAGARARHVRAHVSPPLCSLQFSQRAAYRLADNCEDDVVKDLRAALGATKAELAAARAEIERVKKARRAETLNVMRYAAAKKAGKTARDAYLSKGEDEAVKTERE